MMRKVIAFNLAAVLALGASPILLAQQGVISGRANDEAKKPYSDYTVQLMDLQTNQIAANAPIDAQGRFAFNDVNLDKRYLVQLYNAKDSKVVCTEGPYALTGTNTSKTDVNIDCGKRPTALWLLAAAAGVAATVAVTEQSTSR